MRPPTAHPAQQASVLSAEKHFVYFRGDLVAEWEPTPIEVPGARRFKAGACRHMVQQHETLTSIGARYKLTWQELVATTVCAVRAKRELFATVRPLLSPARITTNAPKIRCVRPLMTLGVYVWKSTMDARWMASAASARQTGPTSAAKVFMRLPRATAQRGSGSST